MTSLTRIFTDVQDKFTAGSILPAVDANQRGNWLEKWGSPLSNDSGVRVSEKSALALTALYRGITLLAGSIATQPRHLFERYGDQMRDKRINREHPAHKVITGSPNGYMNSYQYHFYMVAILLLWGNFYAYISRNAFYQPVALHPIPPWMVEVSVENGNKVFYVNQKKYSNNQILHLFNLSMDGITGVKPIKLAAQNIGLNLAAQSFQSSVFGKGVHAGGVIHIPEEQAGIMGSTDEEAEQYMENVRKSFKALYQNGRESWHNIMFLEPGWKFEQFKLNLETAQIIETRKMGIADIARLIGVPLHKLMQLDDATYNNVEQMGIQYVQDGILPISTNIEAEYNAKLLKASEKDIHFFKFNLDGLMRANLKDRYEAYSIALGKNAPGFMSPEEIRDLEDFGSVDEGQLYKPDNMNRQSDQNEGNQS